MKKTILVLGLMLMLCSSAFAWSFSLRGKEVTDDGYKKLNSYFRQSDDLVQTQGSIINVENGLRTTISWKARGVEPSVDTTTKLVIPTMCYKQEGRFRSYGEGEVTLLKNNKKVTSKCLGKTLSVFAE